MPRRARDESVPRRSLSPLCDASFVETVSTAPGVGADERREGHEGTGTPRWHLTQETVVPTGDVPQRCRRGDEATHARGIDSDIWWSKVDRTPIGSQRGCTSIPRGPYESMRDAGGALRKIARADGRGIKVCSKKHSGKRSVMMCKAVTSLETTGERDINHAVDCAYTAVIERWDAKGAKAPGTYWITKYTPHTFELCQAKRHFSASAIAADSHVSAIITAGGAKTTAKAVKASAQEQLGIELTSSQASRVKLRALGEEVNKYRESFQLLPSYARVFLDRNKGSVFNVRWRGQDFVSLHLAHHGMAKMVAKSSPRMFVIDACTFKGPHYRGHAIQTVAVIDGRLDGATYRNVPLALTISDDEVQESYLEHMEMWKNISLVGNVNEEGGVDTLYDHIVSEDSVIFTDGDLANARQTLGKRVGLMCRGNGHVLVCALRLLANVKKSMNCDTGFSDALFWRLQATETEEAFESMMKQIESEFPRTANYLREQPPRQWTLWGWISSGVSTHGRKTSNPTEQTHSTQPDMRYRSPLAFVEEYLSDAAQLVADLSETAKELRFRRDEHPFTPYATREIEQVQKNAHARAHRAVPTPADPSVWQVIEVYNAQSTTPGLRSHLVNAFERTCTCCGRAKNGYCCVHEYAVYIATERDGALRRQLRMDDYVEWAAQPCFSVRTFIDSVKNVQVALPPASEVTVDPTRRPPGPNQSAPGRGSGLG